MVKLITLRSTFQEGEDWTTMMRVVSPIGVALVPSDITTIEARVYEESPSRSPGSAVVVWTKTGILATDNAPHPYTDPDVLSATLRTEGWEGPGASGYNFLHVIVPADFTSASQSTSGTFVTTGDARYRVVYSFLGASGKWGTITTEHLITVGSNAR